MYTLSIPKSRMRSAKRGLVPLEESCSALMSLLVDLYFAPPAHTAKSNF